MRQYPSLARLISLSALAFAAASPALAQDVRAVPAAGLAQQDRIDDRLERIEDALTDLQAVVYSVDRPRDLSRNTAPAGAAVTPPSAATDAELAIRVSNIESSLASLTGQVEELSFRLRRQQETLDRLSGQQSPEFGAPAQLPDLSDQGISAANAPTGPSTVSQPAGAPTDLLTGNEDAPGAANSVSLPDDPDAAFEQAFQYVLSADYAQAEENLEAFIAKFPEAEQTAEAKYLLGEIYLATGANSEAARIFLDHVSTYKDDPRSPEAYLKLGIAFSRLNRPEEACRVLNAGVRKFPDLDPRLKERYDEERAAASCT